MLRSLMENVTARALPPMMSSVGCHHLPVGSQRPSCFHRGNWEFSLRHSVSTGRCPFVTSDYSAVGLLLIVATIVATLYCRTGVTVPVPTPAGLLSITVASRGGILPRILGSVIKPSFPAAPARNYTQQNTKLSSTDITQRTAIASASIVASAAVGSPDAVIGLWMDHAQRWKQPSLPCNER